MNLKNKLLKVAGKDNFSIDDNISSVYVLRLCWKYGWMMVRGALFSTISRNISSKCFFGKKVKLYEKGKIVIREKTKIHDRVKIDALSSEGVQIGAGCVIGENTKIECTGSLSAVGKGISIGDRTTFGSDCYFGAAGGISIGNDVVAGQYVRFHSENHSYEDLGILIKDQGVTRKGIKIGNNCWIGAGAVFLDGAELSDGCVVAANAVVAKAFGKNSVIGGVPAKVIKKRGEQ